MACRNEGLAYIQNQKPLETDKGDQNDNFYYGKDKPIESVHFSVPDLIIDKYRTVNAGNQNVDEDNKTLAKNAILHEDGIKQMLPIMSFFGKNAFLDGVFVYNAKENKTIKVGEYDEIKNAMDNIITSNTTNKKKVDRDWLNKELDTLSIYSNFSSGYQKFADELTQENIKEYEKSIEEVDKKSTKYFQELREMLMQNINITYRKDFFSRRKSDGSVVAQELSPRPPSSNGTPSRVIGSASGKQNVINAKIKSKLVTEIEKARQHININNNMINSYIIKPDNTKEPTKSIVNRFLSPLPPGTPPNNYPSRNKGKQEKQLFRLPKIDTKQKLSYMDSTISSDNKNNLK